MYIYCAQALGIAAVKAVVCIVGITAGGRLLIRPLYKKISALANAEIFAATTLLVVLGTSFMTQLAGAACRKRLLAGNGFLQEWLAGPVDSTMPAAHVHIAMVAANLKFASHARILLLQRPCWTSKQLQGLDVLCVPGSFADVAMLCLSPLSCGAGLSLALGAFLAGLLLAETEYALQVESDIAPYKGLLMGLFFMTVGEWRSFDELLWDIKCCTCTSRAQVLRDLGTTDA
jgi:hypothetical protein